jgi:hypothetical protein
MDTHWSFQFMEEYYILIPKLIKDKRFEPLNCLMHIALNGR